MGKESLWIVFLIVVFGTACSSNNGADRFIGKWVEEGKELSKPIEIKREDYHLVLLLKDNDETIEFPAIYDKEQKKLSATLSKGGKALISKLFFFLIAKK